MRVFISYHRADTRYRKKLENILIDKRIEYYAVPEDADFNGKKPETIRAFLCAKLKKCDVLICLIGKETYRRPHVDREIHTALKGEPGVRLGIIGVHLPTRRDSLSAVDLNTFPKKLFDNREYVVWADWKDLNEQIKSFAELARERAFDAKIQTTHSHPCLPLKEKIYYDN